MSLTLKPLKHLLRTIPDRLHTRVLSHLANQLMKGQSVTSRLDVLEGKRLQLSITDTGNCWRFIIQGNRLLHDPNSRGNADIHIQGELKTFLLLATRNEDPDTLFFSRQLSLEGNTEDGLYLKNILDAMDFNIEAHLNVVFGKTLAKYLNPVINSIKPDVQLRRLGNYLHAMD